MSEVLGEARIIIRPDTALFRGQLEEQLAALRKPIVIPVVTETSTRGGAGRAPQIEEEVAATEQLTAIQKLGVQAAQQNAAVENALALATAKTIGPKEAAAIASRALATNERFLTEALITQDEALIGTAAESANLARKQAAQAAVAAAAARTQQQVTKGAFSATASQFGLRGATLAASVGFIAAAVGVTALSKSLRAAHDAADSLEIQTQALDATLGQIQAGQFDHFARNLAGSLEVSRIQADQAGAAFSGLLVNFGKTRKEAELTSQQLVATAANLAAFTGRPFEEASLAIQRGLAGNGRGLRAFRVFLDQSRVSEEALRETGKQHASALTRQELVQARLNIIQRDSAVAQNAVAEQQGTLIGQSRTLRANFSNLATVIGGPLNRALFFEARGLNDIFAAGQHVINFLNAGDNPLHRWIFGQDQAKKSADDLVPSLKSVQFVIDHLSSSAGQLSLNLLHTSLQMKDLAHQSDVLDEALLKLEISGGTPEQIIANRQADIATQNAAIARAQARGGAKGSATAIHQAREKIKADQAEIRTQQGTLASDAKSAAAAAQSARDKADQAVLDSISGHETKLTDQLIGAGIKQQIAIEQRLARFYKAAIARVRSTVKNAKTAATEIATLTTDFLTAQNTVKDLQQQRSDAVAAAIAQARQDRLAHLEALLSIALTTPGTADDARRIRAIEAFDRRRIAALVALRKQRKLTREEKQELDALRVDLAQREQALKALTGEQKKNLTAQAEFNFLQTQTGFVQNLIGNLIPGGATGLVGGQTGPTVPENVRPSSALSAAQRTSQANLVRGVTSGQAETQTQILRRILGELHRLNQGSDHPEAKKQRSTGSSAMDYHIQGTYGL